MAKMFYGQNNSKSLKWGLKVGGRGISAQRTQFGINLFRFAYAAKDPAA